ncbi:response regulator [Bacteroides sp. AF25-5LB]|nr:response regulator [Bacteroides sp. AF25-5LB]RJV25491.1 response regulator [Bacteroides sp. AF25-17LB]
MPIVVIAEHCCYTDLQRARQAGCDEVFTKPYSLDWLKERVKHFLKDT